MNSINPRSDWLTKPGGPAERLRAMRMQAFPKAIEFSRAIGWHQSKVSRVETGEKAPTEDEIRRWVEVCGGTTEDVDQLIDLVQHANAIWSNWKQQLRDGAAAAQGNVTALIDGADFVAYFETTVLPGPLQIPGYASALLALLLPDSPVEDRDAAVTARARRWEALYDPTKRWQLVMDESVLHRWPGPADVMRLQLERVRGVLGLPNVDIGVIPLNTTLEVWPSTPFAVYDQVVLVETFTGEITHFPGSVESEQYLGWLGRLWDRAVTDPAELTRMIDVAVARTT